MYQEDARARRGRHWVVEPKDARRPEEVTPPEHMAVVILARHERPAVPVHRRVR